MTKRILITGSLGHIGSKLIHSLTGSDYSQVTMIDNLSTQRFLVFSTIVWMNTPTMWVVMFLGRNINKHHL